MAKTLCDWSKKDIESKSAKLALILQNPRFYCAKCARCANDPRALCKARKLSLALKDALATADG